jgi:hypothetical protein
MAERRLNVTVSLELGPPVTGHADNWEVPEEFPLQVLIEMALKNAIGKMIDSREAEEKFYAKLKEMYSVSNATSKRVLDNGDTIGGQLVQDGDHLVVSRKKEGITAANSPEFDRVVQDILNGR